MSVEKILFYVFSAILVFAATMVITRKNPVHSALYLVLAFFTSSGLWILAEAEFLAIALVLVYVGAVMVLFLFVVMMLDIDLATIRAGMIRYLPIGIITAVVMLVSMWLVVGPEHFGLDKYAAPARHAADYSNTEELGGLLYTVYMYPFEIAAVILLVAIVAAISLTLRHRPDTKYQSPSEQVTVRKADRLRVVKVDSEEKMELK